MSREWNIGVVQAPGRWLVRQEGYRYIIIWWPFDAEGEERGSAENLELAMAGARIFHNDMLERIGSMKKKQTKRKRKNGVVENIPCPGPGQMCLFPRSSRSS
jgi:hypothetical protein